MGDFPWQKDGESGHRWRNRMPWEREGTGPQQAEPGEANGPAAVSEAPDPAATEHAASDIADPAATDAVAPDARAPEPEPPEPDPAEPLTTAPDPVLPPYAAHPPTTPTSTTGTPDPPEAPARPAPKKSRRSYVAGAVVIMVIGGIVGIGTIVGLNEAEPTSSNDDLSANEVALREQQVRQTVLGLFDAVAAADAEAALGFTDVEPGSKEYADLSLLTDDVLAASQRHAPLSDVRIEELTFDADYAWTGTVDVSYLLGEERVEAQYEVREAADTEFGWAVSLTGRSIYLSTAALGPVDVRIGGASAPPEGVLLFPGRYALEIVDHPHLTFEEALGLNLAANGAAEFTVPAPDGFSVTLAVSAEGKRLFRESVTGALEKCLASTAPVSACADPEYSAFGPEELRDGTVSRKLDENSELDVTPRIRTDDYSTLRGLGSVTIDVEGICADGAACTGWEITGTPVVHFGDGEPVVTWE